MRQRSYSGSSLAKEITFQTNTSMNEGDRGRIAHLERAKRILDWQAQVPIQQGLAFTYHWILNDMVQRKRLEPWMLGDTDVETALGCLLKKFTENPDMLKSHVSTSLRLRKLSGFLIEFWEGVGFGGSRLVSGQLVQGSGTR